MSEFKVGDHITVYRINGNEHPEYAQKGMSGIIISDCRSNGGWYDISSESDGMFTAYHVNCMLTSEVDESTPAEKLGYKVGDLFTVMDTDIKMYDSIRTEHDQLRLVYDDGTNAPMFALPHITILFDECGYPIEPQIHEYDYVCLMDVIPYQTEPTEKINCIVGTDESEISIHIETFISNMPEEANAYVKFIKNKFYCGIDGWEFESLSKEIFKRHMQCLLFLYNEE